MKPVRIYRAPLNEDPERLINWFDDFYGAQQYSFLSNFHEAEGVYTATILGAEMTARTTEHLYQAAKAATVQDRRRILHEETPGDAKMVGQVVRLRKDWEEVKVEVMVACLAAKFNQGSVEAALLDQTGTADLVEGTFWGDRIWGVDLHDPDWPGQNLLGALLMSRRALNRRLS